MYHGHPPAMREQSTLRNHRQRCVATEGSFVAWSHIVNPKPKQTQEHQGDQQITCGFSQLPRHGHEDTLGECIENYETVLVFLEGRWHSRDHHAPARVNTVVCHERCAEGGPYFVCQ